MAPLFSKVDLNKLWHDVQNEETLIFAKFGKDLLNIYKVIGLKKVAQFFLTHSVHTYIDLKYINTFITTKEPLWPLTMLCELKAKRSIKYF